MKLRHIKRATQRRAYVNFLAGPTFRLRTYGDANFQCLDYDSGRRAMTIVSSPRLCGKATLRRLIERAHRLRAGPIPAETYEVTAQEFDALKRLVPPAYGAFDFTGAPTFMGMRVVITEDA
jgi:hypothetical protein